MRHFFVCIGIFLSALGGLVYTHTRWNAGFSHHQIASRLPTFPDYALTLSAADSATVQHILNQPFYYLGKGCQCYAFLSKDGEYVLKFLKHKHLRFPHWLQKIPGPDSYQAFMVKKEARRKARVQQLFSSIYLAYTQLRPETGLIYIHLNRTAHLHPTITLVDKIGWRHTLSLDAYEFMIQKRALPAKEVLTECLRHHPEELPHKINQLLEAVTKRCAKGIGDKDRAFLQNVAFSTDLSQVFWIDIGQLYTEPSLQEPEGCHEDIKKRLSDVRHWATLHLPGLLPFLPAL